jgi:hypothetical protein
MFFEVLDANDSRGRIALATSRDTVTWQYQQIVLAEPFHLSYPYVFEWGGRYYLMPETNEVRCIRLYRAIKFPTHWQFECNMIENDFFLDPSICVSNERLWLFTGTHDPVRDAKLRLFYAERITGPWREHPKSPLIVNDNRRARPAGRIIGWNGRLIRFAQDCYPRYGTAVRAFAITELTPQTYVEHLLTPDPILSSGSGDWNRDGMHHIDALLLPDGDWLAAVDGWRTT